jgi:hypothetical protein
MDIQIVLHFMYKHKQPNGMGVTMLVQLCASHIGSTRRLHALLRMLRSLADQSLRAPVWLSISTCASAPELREKAAAALSSFEVTVRWRERAMSQFEHYALLVAEVEEAWRWCIFCDDDDYCHPSRTAWYAAAAAAAAGCETDAILCSNGTLSAMLRGATELDLAGLEAHAAANPRCVGLGGSEHWMFAAKTCVLRAFCEGVPPTILESAGCDIVWRNLLRLSRCEVSESPTWLYAKTMEPDCDEHVSLGAKYDEASIVALCNSSYTLLRRIAGVSPKIARCLHAQHICGQHPLLSIRFPLSGPA